MGFNKKVLSKAVSELDKAKAPAKPRDIITDPMGQWKYPGQETRIPGSSITMQGVNYPVWAQPNVGPGAMMQPNQDYEFPNADYVDETPMAKKGGTAGKLSNDNGLVTKVVPMKFDLPELKGAEKINDKVTLAMSPDSTGLYKIGKDIEKFCGIPEADVIRDVKAGKDRPEDAIIYGMSNIMNGGKDIYLWINATRLQGSAKEKGVDAAIMEIVSHESLHITRKLLTRAIAKSKGVSVDNEDWVKHDYGDGEYMWPAIGDVSEKHPIVQIDEEAFATAEGYVTERILPHFLEMAKKYLDINKDKVFKKGGTLQSKKYSSSISATNKLFAKNKLFENKKSKIFDPNSKFKSGGSKLGPINLNPNPLSHYELNYGYNLPTKQDGGVQGNPWLYTSMQENEGKEPGQIIGLGADFQHKSGLHGEANVELPFFNRNAEGMSTQSLGLKKSYKGFTGDATLNNESYPGSKLNPSLKTSVGYNKNLGDHVGFGVEATNNSVPGKLRNLGLQARMTYNFQDGGENEDEYMDLTDEEIQAYRDAGYEVDEEPEYEIGGYVQHELVKAQTGLTKKPLKISDPDEYAFRKAAYDDSSTMHRLYDNDYNTVKKFKTINEINNYRNSQIKSKGKQENAASIRLGNPNPEKVETHTNLDGEYTTTTYKKPVQPVQFVPNIKSTSKKGVWSGGSEEQLPTGINTSDFERKTREYQQQQRGDKPIAKAQVGLEKNNSNTYTYSGRPESTYQKDANNNWLIKNSSTKGKYIPVQDPTGERTKTLNAQARSTNTYNPKFDQSSESTNVNNTFAKSAIPTGKFSMLNEEYKKTVNQQKVKNDKVKSYMKGYQNSPRYEEMLKQSEPENWQDWKDARQMNLFGYENNFGDRLKRAFVPGAKNYTNKVNAPNVTIAREQGDEGNTGGFSQSDSGNITVLPRGYEVKGLIAHETSHSEDRPLTDNMNFKTGLPYAPNLFNSQGDKRLIPNKDAAYIIKNQSKNWRDSPEYKKLSPGQKRTVKNDPDLYKRKEKFMKYVGEPTETRARLNDIRYQSKQRGLYDPYKEKVTPKTYKKLLETEFEKDKNEGFDALKQLKDVYNDKQIQWMLNNISKNKDQQDSDMSQGYGKEGGSIEAWEDELDEYTIALLRRAGYIVEEID